MTDRSSYFLLNTGINLASNAGRLKTNDEGDVEAVCELEIPNDLIPNAPGYIGEESLEMEATRLQLSLKNIPLAQIPLDVERSPSNENYISTCELDVWPFSLDEVNQIHPATLAETAFPNYYHANNTFSMNLMIPRNTNGCTVEKDVLYIRDLAVIEKMLENALENAMTLACTTDTTPPTSILTLSIKPKVSFNSEGFSISYDTAPFYDNVNRTTPVLWNQSQIENYTTAPQIRQNLPSWVGEPPMKRVFRYNTTFSASGSFNYTVPSTDENTAVFNIVGNKAMYETFSFLPWIKVNISNISGISPEFYPHLTMSDNCFYILNCQSAKMDVSSPEALEPSTLPTTTSSTSSSSSSNTTSSHSSVRPVVNVLPVTRVETTPSTSTLVSTQTTLPESVNPSDVINLSTEHTTSLRTTPSLRSTPELYTYMMIERHYPYIKVGAVEKHGDPICRMWYDVITWQTDIGNTFPSSTPSHLDQFEVTYFIKKDDVYINDVFVRYPTAQQLLTGLHDRTLLPIIPFHVKALKVLEESHPYNFKFGSGYAPYMNGGFTRTQSSDTWSNTTNFVFEWFPILPTFENKPLSVKTTIFQTPTKLNRSTETFYNRHSGGTRTFSSSPYTAGLSYASDVPSLWSSFILYFMNSSSQINFLKTELPVCHEITDNTCTYTFDPEPTFFDYSSAVIEDAFNGSDPENFLNDSCEYWKVTVPTKTWADGQILYSAEIMYRNGNGTTIMYPDRAIDGIGIYDNYTGGTQKPVTLYLGKTQMKLPPNDSGNEITISYIEVDYYEYEYVRLTGPTLEERVESLETRMTTAEGNISTNTSNISTNTDNITSLGNRVTSLEAQQTQTDVDTTNLTNRLSLVWDTVYGRTQPQTTGLVYKVAVLEAKMTMAEGNISTNAGNISTLQTKTTTLEHTVDGYGDDPGLSATVSDLVDRTTALEHTVDGYGGDPGLSGDVSALSSRLSTVETTVNGNGNDVNGLVNDVSTLQTSVSGLNTIVNGNGTTVNGLVNDVSSLKTTVNGNGSDINGLVNDVSSLKTSVDTVSGRVTTLEHTVDGYENAQEEHVDGLTERVTRLEETVGDLDVTVNGEEGVSSNDGLVNRVDGLEGDVRTMQGEIEGLQPGNTVVERANLRLSYTWEGLPMTAMSPLSSIILTLDGIDIISQRQPINPIDMGGSTITQQYPILEHYYVMAQSFDQLHDELYVVKENFDNNIKFRTKLTTGQQRYMKLSAKYLTKDGRLHDLYIPKNGNFMIQLAFRMIYNWTPPG